MNRLSVLIVVFVVLSVIDQGLGAGIRNIRSLKKDKNRQATDKQRYKRQIGSGFGVGFGSGYGGGLSSVYDRSLGSSYGGGLGYGQGSYASYGSSQLPSYGASIAGQNSFAVQNLYQGIAQHSMYVGGIPTIQDFHTGNLAYPGSNLLTANGITAYSCNHITTTHLAALNIYPVPTLNFDSLLNAGYIQIFGQFSILTGLGLQAIMIGHILRSQLQSLGLYPLQESAYTYETLIQSNYVTKQCIPTALGLTALDIQYLPNTAFTSLDNCPASDVDSLGPLRDANYLFGRFNLLTSVAFAAIQSGYISIDRFQLYGLFPYGAHVQTSEPDYQQQTLIVSDLVHNDYVTANNFLITQAGFQAISTGYFSQEFLHSLNIWPFTGTPRFNDFVKAGYCTYSGHLTTLGADLYTSHYFSASTLGVLGLRVSSHFTVMSHAIHTSGYFQSDYNRIHSTAVATVPASASTVSVSGVGSTATPIVVDSDDSRK